jgi:1-aminocyclopropane-1-carboxylate deaminase/D-cysteine desulfhydrase-like pyridoxal-dependent ACC family enzyme
MSQLNQLIDSYQRLRLAQMPSPLEPLPQISQALRRPVFIKRDDQLGPALGGNKARKLEYLMAEARHRGARRVVTYGGLQSNHARMTAAVARMCGMEPHLLYFDWRPRRPTGNLKLAQLLGARMHFVPFGGSGGMSIERSNRLVQILAMLLVGRHYFIPVGGHSWLGCLGYVRCALELAEQACTYGLGEARVICAAGTGGTLAGLMAGFAASGAPLQPLGIDIGKLWRAFPHSIAGVANELCVRLGAVRRFHPEEVPLIEGRYVGAGYARPSRQGNAAIMRLAQLEGIVLDPVYTGKAFGGLLDLAERGELGRGTPLIFVHTGGTPALFADL